MKDITRLNSFYDLATALARRTKMKQTALSYSDLLNSSELDKPLIFVLVDGLGECYLKRLPETSFLRQSQSSTLQSVFPSTTACAMLSLATGLPPAAHGIPGRYSYDKVSQKHIDSLAFRDRFNGHLLTENPGPKQFWPFPSFIAQAEIPAYAVIPQTLRNSPFERYLCGETGAEGYNSISNAIDVLINHANGCSTRGFYFLYLWDLDSLGHERGTNAEEVNNLIQVLDNELERLWSETRNKADLVISADHGQIDAGHSSIITPEHKLMSYLEAPPFGEPRAAQLQVRQDCVEEFLTYFEETFTEGFKLLPIVEAAGLFGSRTFSPHAALTFANYIAIAKQDNLLIYTAGDPSNTKINKGEHGGNHSEERLIPLIIPE